MRTIRRLFFRVLSVFRSGRADADLAGGTDPHLQLLQDKVPSAAEQAKESQHDARSFRALDSWWLDVKLGVRMLIKYPGLALAGGAGIAVAVAIAAGGFSVIYGNFLASSLPLEEGDRIVSIEIWDSAASKPEPRILHDYHVWREELKSVQEISAFRIAYAKPDRSRRTAGERPRCVDERLGIQSGPGPAADGPVSRGGRRARGRAFRGRDRRERLAESVRG